VVIASADVAAGAAVATEIVREAVVLCGLPAESSTVTEKPYCPPAVGVPDICPPLDRLRPGGNCPDPSFQLYGVVPPLACKAAEYGWLVVPLGNDEVEITSGLGAGVAAATLKESDCLAVCPDESNASTVKEKVPDAVGVPERVPVVETSPIPGGKKPENISQE
jgi:hypothetical protein